MDRYGVIDLGTNTFHLLIAEKDFTGGIHEILRKRKFVKLGEEGLETIGPAPFQRGLQTILEFRRILDDLEVANIRAFGTAALRTAGNGHLFIAEVKALTGISIQLISGQEEARLIHRGVIRAVPLGRSPMLIMDIGGGSVEFIIANKMRVMWAESFPVGIAILCKQFHHSDPIAEPEIRAIRQFLEEQLKELFAMLEIYPTHTLIGASGIFDVLEDLLVKTKVHRLRSGFSAGAFYPLYHRIIPTSQAERLAMDDIPDSRVDMIVVAFVLLEFVFRRAHIREVIVSAYAMKEGILQEMIESGK